MLSSTPPPIDQLDPQHSLLNVIANTELGLALVPAVIFLIVYTLKAPWWRSSIGRMFVIGQTALTLISIVVLLSLILGPDYPGRYWIRVVAYGAHLFGQVVFLLTYLIERKSPDPRIPRIPKTKEENDDRRSRRPRH